MLFIDVIRFMLRVLLLRKRNRPIFGARLLFPIVFYDNENYTATQNENKNTCTNAPNMSYYSHFGGNLSFSFIEHNLIVIIMIIMRYLKSKRFK